MKHLAAPKVCERCDQKIDARTGWGVVMTFAVQPQPDATNDNREKGLMMCGYCFHELADWFCPEDEPQA